MKAFMIVMAALAATVLPKTDGADDKEEIQGTWKVISALADGVETPDAEQVKQARWVIDAQELATELGGESRKASYTLDPTKEPRTLDITPLGGPENEKGKTFPCIYSLEGDTLRASAH